MTAPAGREQELTELRAAVADGRSVLITGPLGIGKSSLLRALTIDHPRRWQIWRATSNEAAATIPFGAVASWLPSVDSTREAAVIDAAVGHVIQRSGGCVPVLVVDDIHHLDRTSVQLVHEVATATGAPVIAATHVEDRLPATLMALFEHLDSDRMDLGPLPDAALRDLAASQFTTRPDQRVVDELVERSRGNPLFLLELAHAHGSRAAGGTAGGLTNLVHTRLSSLSDPARTLLGCVAIAEPVPMCALASIEMLDDAAVDELERAALITIAEEPHLPDDAEGRVDDEPHLVVRCAHPIYAEMVRAGLTPGARHLAAAALSRALLTSRERRDGDALRLAGSLLELDEPPGADLAMAAAREALTARETDVAQRLVEAALDADPDRPDALALAGSIHDLAGDPARAESLYRRLLVRAKDDADIVAAAMPLLWHANHLPDGHPDRAELRVAAARIRSPMLRHWLDIISEPAPSYDDLLTFVARLSADPDPDERIEWAVLLTALIAESTICRLARADEHLARVTPLLARQASTDPTELDVLSSVELSIHLQRGRFDTAFERAQCRLDDARRTGRPYGATACATAVLVHWPRGEIATARQQLREAVDEVERFDPLNVAPLAHSHVAMLAAADGDGEVAEHHWKIADQHGAVRSPYTRTWFLRAEGWLATLHDRDAAVELFAAAARAAVETNQFVLALLALQDAVMLDAAESVSHQLAGLADKPVEAPFMELLVDHARARADGDLGAISTCAGGFEQVGAAWYAANAWQAVARLAPDDAERSRAATRAMVVGPAAALGPHAAETRLWALSPRRTEIALLAARGATSKVIADELNLSVRTVDDSLHRTYKAFGISGREELGLVLPPPAARHVQG